MMRHGHRKDDNGGLPELLMARSGHETSGVRKVVITGCAVNALLMIMKLCAGWFGHSEALVADGFHSLNDVAVDLIMLVFVGISYRKASAAYAYGYGKYETLASLLIAMLMIFISVMIGIEAVESIISYAHGAVLEHPDIWTVFAVIAAMGTKECLYHYYSGSARRYGSIALKAAGWHHRVDAMTSVATLIGVVAAHFLGEKFRVFDPCASLLIALMILIPALRLLIPTFTELMEKSLPHDEEEKARKTIGEVAGVEGIASLKTRRSGHNRMFDIAIYVAPGTTVEQGAAIAGKIEEALQHSFCPHIFVSVMTKPRATDHPRQ